MNALKLLVFAAMLTVAVSSCKKDSKPIVKNKEIFGIWLLKKQVNKSYSDGIITREDTKIDFSSEYFQFQPNGDGISYFGKMVPLTWFITDDQKISIISKGENKVFDIVYYIKSLNETDLILYLEFIEKRFGVDYKNTTELRFKRK